ncbi:type II secretion system protein [Deinococcus apachensis]|uniref:type II secretion system protein n=1 Tax=Deinococcus apachensis TaxID=309886 RepID=UPI00146A13A5
MSRANIQAFTLLEVLLTASILLILLGLLIPNLIKARAAANNSSAQSLARNITNMAEIHRPENPGALIMSRTGCAPTLISSLPSEVRSCQVYQDNNSTYVLTESTSDRYYYFDGQKIRGPLISIPSDW